MKPSYVNNSHSAQDESSLYSIKEEGLSIAGKDLVDILQDVLSKGVPFRLQAPGFSMSPFIKDGDIVTVTRLPDGSPGIGDVVAFTRPNVERLIVHRVVGKKNGCFVIKGDSAPDTDGLIPGTNILGCVKKVERRGKKVFLGLGPERLLIAFLSRRGLLLALLCRVGWLLRPFIRREST